MHDSTGIIQKKQRAISVLRKHRGVLVALSGGVDSAVLLAVAAEALGTKNVIAVTGRSAAVTDQEVGDAGQIARAVGVRHDVVETRELDSRSYRANTGDRCFHCRSELFAVLSRVASFSGMDAIAYGAIVDDLGDDRPGMEAARRLGILAPLLDAGICKNDVRILANEFNLHVHDKPASPCLASRIPIGTEVTKERLAQVGAAEEALRTLGFRVFRVRHHGEVGLLELEDRDAARLTNVVLRAEVVAAVRTAGFRRVVLDLESRKQEQLYSIGPIRPTGQ